MSDIEATPQTLTTIFQTWHNSNGDVHLRTDSELLFISKKDPELVEISKTIQRGQKIKATGTVEFSKTLSSHVLHLSALEPQ